MSHTDEKPCPFCVMNGQVNVIEFNRKAFLVQAVKGGAPAPGRYLIIPTPHITSLFERPANWTRWENELLGSSMELAQEDETLVRLMQDRPLSQALNTSWNQGQFAGQRVEHMHLWVIFRYDDLEIGLDALIEREFGRQQSAALTSALGSTH